MRDLIFACLLSSAEAEQRALRLARSIRSFGGELCFNPIWMLSQHKEEDLSQSTRQELYSLGARLVNFDLDAQAVNFPFAGYVASAGIAEGLAQGEASFLAMMATDTLVLQAPAMFRLAGGKSLGACPVQLKILGSEVNEPADNFWQLIYHQCGVQPERIFPVQSIVDQRSLRAYFNAGLLVVRPERGLLRAWQADFERLYRLPEFEEFYLLDDLYRLFMHQMVLAGTVLSLLKQEDIQLFPFDVNYPLHLHTRVAPLKRPSHLEELITCRYEDYQEIFSEGKLDCLIHVEPQMKDWLEAQ